MSDAGISNEFITQQLQALQAQVNLQNETIATLQRERALVTDKLRLRAEVESLVPPHLQLEPLPEEDRKAILRKYPKVEQLPKAIGDTNGFATNGLPSDKKNWITKDLVSMQRDSLDIVRVAVATLHQAYQTQPSEEAYKHIMQALASVVTLAADNAQRAADKQLKMCLEAAGAKGAEALLQRKPGDECDIDMDNENIFHQGHVDAIKDYKRFASSVEKARASRPTGGYNANRGGKCYRQYRPNNFSGFKPYSSFGGGKGGKGNRGGYGHRDYNNRGGKGGGYQHKPAAESKYD